MRLRLHSIAADLFKNVTFSTAATRPHFLNVTGAKTEPYVLLCKAPYRRTSFPWQVLFARVYAKKMTIFPWQGASFKSQSYQLFNKETCFCVLATRNTFLDMFLEEFTYASVRRTTFPWQVFEIWRFLDNFYEAAWIST